MVFLNILIYFVLALVLFSLILLIDSRSKIDYKDKIVISNLYIILISIIMSKNYDFNSNLFIIFLFIMFIDVIYSSYILDKDIIKNGGLLYYFVLIVIGYIINSLFINNSSNGISEFRIVVWVFIGLYIYNLFKGINFKSNDKIDKESVIVSYAKMKNKYNLSYSKSNNLIIYSIMIYNNRRRPSILREFDNLLYRFNGKRYKSGIMQIDSNNIISDIDSINYVYKDIVKSKSKDYKKILSKYSDSSEIIEIYEIIKGFSK